MDRQPALEGDLLTLRPAVREDFDALFAVASDPSIWEVHPAHDRWQAPVFRRFFDDGLASGGMLGRHRVEMAARSVDHVVYAVDNPALSRPARP